MESAPSLKQKETYKSYKQTRGVLHHNVSVHLVVSGSDGKNEQSYGNRMIRLHEARSF